jgi:hypothetical protein
MKQKKPLIIAVARVRDEEDIIEFFVRHTLVYADKIILSDHCSCDRTTEILKRLVEEGLPLDVRRDDREGRFQAEVTHQLLLDAAAMGADWLLPLDADEFISCEEDFLPLPGLESAGEARYWTVPWKTYVPRKEDDAKEPVFHKRIQHHVKPELDDKRKAIIPGRLYRRGGVRVIQGNHILLSEEGHPLPAEPFQGFTYAHFMLRSPGQYIKKLINLSIASHVAFSRWGSRDLLARGNVESLIADWEKHEELYYKYFPDRFDWKGLSPGECLVRNAFNYRGAPPRNLPGDVRTDDLAPFLIKKLHPSLMGGKPGNPGVDGRGESSYAISWNKAGEGFMPVIEGEDCILKGDVGSFEFECRFEGAEGCSGILEIRGPSAVVEIVHVDLFVHNDASRGKRMAGAYLWENIKPLDNALNFHRSGLNYLKNDGASRWRCLFRDIGGQGVSGVFKFHIKLDRSNETLGRLAYHERTLYALIRGSRKNQGFVNRIDDLTAETEELRRKLREAQACRGGLSNILPRFFSGKVLR